MERLNTASIYVYILTLKVSFVMCGIFTVFTLILFDIIVSHNVHFQFMLFPIGGATDITDKWPNAFVNLVGMFLNGSEKNAKNMVAVSLRIF